MIAPSRAAGAAIFSAASTPGIAAMSCTFVNCFHRPLPYAEIRSRLARSAARSPSRAPTTVVKNTEIAARNTIGVRPPNTILTIGPIAISGMQ